ncbi:MAG TPA: hypothetical protein VFB96_20765 [Pirellulaceae bacterium]|nr:hypothetical protein [Pirellulaceae bacterium]
MTIRQALVRLRLILGIGLAMLFRQGYADDGSTWRYVVPDSTGSGFASPTVVLPLADQRPEAIKTEPPASGGKRSYALLRYGSPNSPLLPIVVDQRDGEEFDLTIDFSRSGEMADARPIAGSGRARQLEIKSAITYRDRAAEEYPRQVLIRKSASGKSLSVATLGYLAGGVTLGERTIAARRVDGNANGLFADPQDRLWLDMNGDGKFDPFDEQFPFQPVLSLEGQRYAMRSDEAGTRLALDEITGIGKIVVKLETLPESFELKELELSLAARDGSVYSARGSSEPIDVPPGEYATRALSLLLVHRQSEERWYFVFSRYDSPREQDWHAVAAAKEISIDPVGKLDFRLEGAALEQKIPAGSEFRVEPGLYTQDGMLIQRCDEGAADTTDSYSQGRAAEVELMRTDGTVISRHTSGFG